jgi:hypothetical protein
VVFGGNGGSAFAESAELPPLANRQDEIEQRFRLRELLRYNAKVTIRKPYGIP